MKMKILTIQAAYFPMIGGAELFHQKTAEWLAEKGYQVDIVTCVWDKPDIAWKNWQKEKEKINKVNIYRVKPWFYRQYFKSFGAIIPLYKRSLQLIKEYNYDLIHVHIFPALIVGAMLKTKTKLPLVATIQGGDVADYSETGSGFSLFLKPIIAWALRKSDIVHTVSTQLKMSVKTMGIKNTKVIPNGVDTLIFKPRNKKEMRSKYQLASGKFVIISHSRLTPKNGLDILIKAIADLPDKNQIQVLLVGGGEQESELKKLVDRTDLSTKVRFLGYQDQQTTAELLSLADVFVRPSRQEGFGIAFLEAMAAGLPVIGTKTGGIKKIIDDNKNGFLIELKDVDSLSRAIEKLRNNKLSRKKMGEEGRKKAKKNYSWEKICYKIEKLYTQINHD